jgi:hypothetical protein
MDKGTVHHEYRPTKICVWWNSGDGSTVGQRLYPRTRGGYFAAKRRIMDMVAKGFTIVIAPRLRQIPMEHLTSQVWE